MLRRLQRPRLAPHRRSSSSPRMQPAAQMSTPAPYWRAPKNNSGARYQVATTCAAHHTTHPLPLPRTKREPLLRGDSETQPARGRQGKVRRLARAAEGAADVAPPSAGHAAGFESALEGEVGDCCGGQGHGGHSSGQPSQRSSGGHAHAERSSLSTAYYGLVVQSAQPCDTDGCFVLKLESARTASSAAADTGALGSCRCTHYTLTRVCHGQPLAQQLRDAWLV